MQISISLPRTPNIEKLEGDDLNYDYRSIKHFLRQLELSVHHAQKSLEEIKKMNDETDNPGEINVYFEVCGFEPNQTGSYRGLVEDITLEIYTN